MTSPKITDSVVLPCGATLKNRIAKSAMSENMATNHIAGPNFEKAYATWAAGGCGLLVTGNVMIDSRRLGEPNNVVIEEGFSGAQGLARWASAAKQNGTHVWMQLNHPGKQSPKFLSKEPVAPSAVPFQSPMASLFNTPRALGGDEILDVIKRFGFAAKVAKEAGFTGVQIHGAHGYLVSQFLSPRHNVRTDEWGGSLENRMRFVIEVYKSIREAVGSQFPVAIKLNSADFQKGGFTEDESIQVVQRLADLGMDLIEISGGTYEAPEMTGVRQAPPKESTRKREAYFLEYCERVRKVVQVPLMLTGGFRTPVGMAQALESKACDVIGLARSVALLPDFPNKILAGENVESQVAQLTTGFKAIDKVVPLEIIWYTAQIHRMGKGKLPDAKASALGAALSGAIETGWHSLFRVRA